MGYMKEEKGDMLTPSCCLKVVALGTKKCRRRMVYLNNRDSNPTQEFPLGLEWYERELKICRKQGAEGALKGCPD